jgi:hypothetical protein
VPGLITPRPTRWLVAQFVNKDARFPLPRQRRRRSRAITPIFAVMQHLDVTDAALIKELADITGNDRYPFSARIQTLRAILAKLRPESAREPLPPQVNAPPRFIRERRLRR